MKIIPDICIKNNNSHLMKHILLSIVFFTFCIYCNAINLSAIDNYSFLVNDSSVVRSGKNIRFTVLTDAIIRMEWDSTGQFTDNPSFAFINRDLPVPQYKSKVKGGWLVITTDKVILKYKIGSGKFNHDNLSVRSAPTVYPFEWHPGDRQTNNLKGTYRTLDCYNGNMGDDGKEMPMEDGLLATDGWTLIDDSKNFIYDDDKSWPWVEVRKNTNCQDWYFMGYGHDYKQILKDFTLVAGKVPLPPRYAFGYWWSRYWSYSDKELRQLVNNFDVYRIPVDVLVIDMDWHITFRDNQYARDEFDQRIGWTGWTWNNRLFPQPDSLLQWLNRKNINVTLNLHPASGVAPYDVQYKALASKLDFDTTTHKNIPWQASNKKFITNFFDVVIHPLEKQGVDFWWLDWQQWRNDKQIAGLSNTWWINYVFFTEMEKNRNTRPILYHRWGGLGNHRYQIGFSGDSYMTWKTLEFQPYFTSCASNVLYGYWSHDIGGHQLFDIDHIDPELFTRWLQYGVFSPILRTHSTKDSRLNKEIWNFSGEFRNAQYNALKLRYQIAPYIYTMARKCHDTGISICRPMYYDYPNDQLAYSFSREYMFGDDMLISPISQAANSDGYTLVNVWLPEGCDWYEWHTGTLLKGGKTLTRQFSIDEYPIYVKAGAIIPTYVNAMNLKNDPDSVCFSIFPGGNGSSSKMYEDNGNDKDYENNYANTNVVTKWFNDSIFDITIKPREGSFKDMKSKRNYSVKLYGVPIPKSVKYNGKTINSRYVGNELALVIELGDVNCSFNKEITIEYQSRYPEINDGLVEKFKRLSKATTELKFRDSRVVLPEAIGKAEETSISLEYFPEKFNELINNFREMYKAIPSSLDDSGIDPTILRWYFNEIDVNKKK